MKELKNEKNERIKEINKGDAWTSPLFIGLCYILNTLFSFLGIILELSVAE